MPRLRIQPYTLSLLLCLSLWLVGLGEGRVSLDEEGSRLGAPTKRQSWWFIRSFHNKKQNQQQQHDDMSQETGETSNEADDNDDSSEVVMNLLLDLDRKLQGSVVMVLPQQNQNQQKQNEAQAEERSSLLVKDLTWSKPIPVPLAIVQVASTEDVGIAVPILAQIKKNHNVDFRIRSGGHHYNGYSSISNGIVLDLSNLNSIKLDNKQTVTEGEGGGQGQPLPLPLPPRRTAWLGPTVSGGDIWRELVQKHQLGALMGGCPAVNQGGYLLGGGFSYWSRLYGLGCDRVRQAKVVLVDGSIVVANATNQYSDMFWALRGAGSAGIAGVVTEFQVELFDAQDEQVYGMGLIETTQEAAQYLSKIGGGGRDNFASGLLPGNVGMSLFLFPSKYFGPDFVALYNWYDAGGIDNLQTGLETLNTTFHQTLTKETANRFGLEIKSATEHSKNGIMEGRLWRVWNGFLMPNQCTPKVLDKLLGLLREIRDLGEGYVTVEILLWGGAISEPSPKDTAFFWRRGRFNICVNLGVPMGVSNAHEIFKRQQDIQQQAWQKVKKFLKGCYYNYPERRDAYGATSKDYFGGNLGRLRRIKRKYDPDDVFGHPQSISA